MSNQKPVFSFSCKSDSFAYESPAIFENEEAAKKAAANHVKMYAEKMKITTKQHKQK